MDQAHVSSEVAVRHCASSIVAVVVDVVVVGVVVVVAFWKELMCSHVYFHFHRHCRRYHCRHRLHRCLGCHRCLPHETRLLLHRVTSSIHSDRLPIVRRIRVLPGHAAVSTSSCNDS